MLGFWRNDEGIVLDRSTDKELSLDRRSRRRPADDATARKYVVKFTVRQSIRIRIEDIPLPGALEQHSVSFSKIFDKGLGVGHIRHSGIKYEYVRMYVCIR